MQVTKGTWRMREQCVPGSLSSSHAQEPGNEARLCPNMVIPKYGSNYVQIWLYPNMVLIMSKYGDTLK